MLDQVQAEIFQRLEGMLASQGVDRVLHGVGRKDFAIVTLAMRGFKVAFKPNGQSNLANIVAALLLGYAQQLNS
jgi:hypothetical protein